MKLAGRIVVATIFGAASYLSEAPEAQANGVSISGCIGDGAFQICFNTNGGTGRIPPSNQGGTTTFENSQQVLYWINERPGHPNRDQRNRCVRDGNYLSTVNGSAACVRPR